MNSGEEAVAIDDEEEFKEYSHGVRGGHLNVRPRMRISFLYLL